MTNSHNAESAPFCYYSWITIYTFLNVKTFITPSLFKIEIRQELGGSAASRCWRMKFGQQVQQRQCPVRVIAIAPCNSFPALFQPSKPRIDVLVSLIVDLNGSYWDADRLRIGGVLMLPVGICRGYSINLSSLICLFNCQPFPLFTRCFSTSQLSLSKSNNPCCQSPRFISHTQLDSSRLAAKLIEK